LKLLSLLYISIPYWIFFGGWLKTYLAIPVSIALAVGIYLSLQHNKNLIPVFSLKKEYIAPCITLLLLLAWVFFSGAGGFSYQNPDYIKHNAILRDLIQLDWPVSYLLSSTGEESVKLVYYIALYLPAALIGKWTSYYVATQVFFFWVLCGTLLSFLWFSSLVKSLSVRAVLFFVLFGGLDILGWLFYHRTLPIGAHIEWWSGIWQYSSNTTLLYWVPQHAIPGWILTGMILSEVLKKDHYQNSIFYVSLGLLWSPFISIGLFLIALPTIFTKKIKKFFSFQNLCVGSFLTLLIGLYFMAHFPNHHMGWVWEYHSPLRVVGSIFIFYILEFGLFFFLTFSFLMKHYKEYSLVVIASIVSLTVFPLFLMGYANDFVMRASIPALFVLQIMLGIILFSKRSNQKSPLRGALIILVCIGFVSGVFEITRSLRLYDVKIKKPLHVTHLNPIFSLQYLGSEKSLFFKHLSKSTQSNVVIPTALKENSLFREQINK